MAPRILVRAGPSSSTVEGWVPSTTGSMLLSQGYVWLAHAEIRYVYRATGTGGGVAHRGMKDTGHRLTLAA